VSPRLHRRSQRTIRRWKRRLAPDATKRPIKAPPRVSTRLRRLFWNWVPWAALTLVMIAQRKWAAAGGSGVMAWISFLIAPVEHPPQHGLDHEFAVDDPEFLPTISGASGQEAIPGNAITILNNGDEFYPAMLDAIRSATDSITIEAYIYWAGDIGEEFAQALADRGRDGVAVKILLDAVGCSTIGENILKTLADGQCHVAWYNPIRWYSIGRLNHRTHRKSLIIDGCVAFTGGAGIADHWRGCAQDAQHWRDIQIRIEGPAVRPLQTGFSHNWLQTTGELISGEPFYPRAPKAGSLPAFTIMSSPEIGASAARTMYYLSIVCARRSIYISNPYFVPDEVAVAGLIDARRRGVDVQIIVSGIHNDAWLARRNSVRLYGDLLREGITIFEYNRTMLHQKTMVVDGAWATVGTTNFDNRSFAHNEENNVCVYDPEWAGELHRVFLEDARVSDRVTYDAWRRRGLAARLGEFVAAFLEDQV
jgi:cardiolipin synthase